MATREATREPTREPWREPTREATREATRVATREATREATRPWPPVVRNGAYSWGGGDRGSPPARRARRWTSVAMAQGVTCIGSTSARVRVVMALAGRWRLAPRPSCQQGALVEPAERSVGLSVTAIVAGMTEDWAGRRRDFHRGRSYGPPASKPQKKPTSKKKNSEFALMPSFCGDPVDACGDCFVKNLPFPRGRARRDCSRGAVCPGGG